MLDIFQLCISKTEYISASLNIQKGFLAFVVKAKECIRAIDVLQLTQYFVITI